MNKVVLTGDIDVSFFEEFEDQLSENTGKRSLKPAKFNKNKDSKAEGNNFEKEQNRRKKERENKYVWEDTAEKTRGNIEQKPHKSFPKDEEKPCFEKNFINFSNKIEEKQPSSPSKIKEIRGKTFDFNKIIAIEKIENEYNGAQTYGIKLIYPGKKGYFGLVWFGQNIRERDRIFSELKQEFNF